MARTGLWWGTIEGAGVVDLIDAAAAAGFSDISITPAMYFAARAQGLTDAELRARLDERGVSVGVIDPLLRGMPGAPSPEEVGPRFRSTFEHGEDDCYRIADALGVRMINVAHYLGAPTPVGRLVDAIGAICARAAARGIDVLVEFIPEGSIPDVTTGASIVRDINAPNCGLMFDTWHFWRAAGDLEAVRSLPTGVIRAMQLSDAEPDLRGCGTNPPTRDRLLPGEGVIPLREIVTLARANRDDVVIGVEVFNQKRADRPFAERASAAMQSLKELLVA